MQSNSIKILIIDDQRLVRDSLSELFRAEGHATITASSIKEAKTVIERETFDVALVDFWMPDVKSGPPRIPNPA